MASNPLYDKYMHTLTGVNPSHYEYDYLDKIYKALIPRVEIVMKATTHGEVAEDLKMKINGMGFLASGKSSPMLEKLLQAVRNGSDAKAASTLKAKMDHAHTLTQEFIRINGASVTVPDKYETASNAYDLTRQDLDPIIAELSKLWHVLNGDAHTFEGHVPLLLKVGFTAKTVVAVNAVRLAFPIIATLGTQVAVVEAGSEAPPAAAAGALTVCAEAATFLGVFGIAIGYVIADIGLWLNAPTLVPEVFFTMFGSASKATEKLTSWKGDFDKINTHLTDMPGKFGEISRKIGKLVHMS